MNTLTKFEPFPTVNTLHERVNQMFNDVFAPFLPFNKTLPLANQDVLGTYGFAPPVDIYEDENKLTFKVEVPGIEEKDLKIEIEGNTLIITGERKLEPEEKKEMFVRVERRYGAFTRYFTLPPTIDVNNVDAKYINGVLTLTLLKKAEAKPKQIKVKFERTFAKTA
jgi:HSP20 family protein